MTLSAESKLGPYEILSPIGAGGMGEVYRRFTCSGIWRRILQTQKGLVVTSLNTKDQSLLLPESKSGGYRWVTASRDGKVLYLVRLHDNADIWMATPP